MAYFLSMFRILLVRERLSRTFPVCVNAEYGKSIASTGMTIFFISERMKVRNKNSKVLLLFYKFCPVKRIFILHFQNIKARRKAAHIDTAVIFYMQGCFTVNIKDCYRKMFLIN